MIKNILELKPHPLNDTLFRDLSTEDYAALKKDIAKNGITNDIHIKEDGTIITGLIDGIVGLLGAFVVGNILK